MLQLYLVFAKLARYLTKNSFMLERLKASRSRLGKKTQKIFILVREGISREDIVEKMKPEIARREVLARISDLRSQGRLPKLTAEEIQIRHQEGGRFNRVVYGYIEPYAQIRMSPVEIYTALRLEGIDNFTYRQVLRSYDKGVRRGGILKVRGEARVDSRKIKSAELISQMQKRVVDCLITNDYLREKGLSLPKSRNQWEKAIDSLPKKLSTLNIQKDFIFAKALLAENLIDFNLTNRFRLIYKENKKTLPESFSQRLRLAVLFKALEDLRDGKNDRIIKFETLGYQVDPFWFKRDFIEEEGFIKAKLLTNWADGEDEKGFYVMNDGDKSRKLVSEDGEYVYDNSSIYLKRMRLRNTIRVDLKKTKTI